MADELVHECTGCGASVYQEHIDSGMARHEDGKLMCPHCVAECDRARAPSPVGAGGGGGSSDDDDLDIFEPIAFDDADDNADKSPDMSQTRVSTMTESVLGAAGVWDDSQYDRPLDSKSTSASRCRMFHCKLSDAAVNFMGSQINDWLDKNEEIKIKFATSQIGLFEGKHSELNLILTLFY
jgi:hypothetical protein